MKRILRKLTHIGGWLFTIGCCGIILGSIAALLIFNHYTKDLPDYSALENYNPPTMTRIYSADGKLITEYAREKRIYVPLSVVPDKVIYAFLSAEDKNFYSHTGIDYQGILRALYANLSSMGGGRLVGGSTITQQVVKNFLLTNEQSLKRKVREAVLAIRITNVYSKDRILELYLNEIYLGHRSYGIAAAAQNYFNRSLSELTLEEAALLASLPKAPSDLNPHKNYEAALERRNWVLERMYEDNRISLEEMQKAQATPITLRERDEQETIHAPYFAAEVKRILKDELGEKIMNEGGLSIITTLSPEYQTMADAALRKQLITYDRRHGYRGPLAHVDSIEHFDAALKKHKANRLLLDDQQLAMVLKLENDKAQIGFADGKSGIIPQKLLGWTQRVMSGGVLGPETKTPADILAVGDIILVGKPDEEQQKKLSKEEQQIAWDLQQVPQVNGGMVVTNPHNGKVLAMSGGYHYQVSSFNRATQAKRQPGSSFKPFVYLSAFEAGLNPSTLVMDGPVELDDGTGEVWRPENYGDDYLGPTTIRRGLEKSRNTMTVRIGQAIGMTRVAEIGERFGIYDKVTAPNLSMVLGTLETSVENMVNAYAILANGGRKVEPILVERVQDRHGNVIYQRDLRGCPTCMVDSAAWNPGTLQPPALFDPRERIVDARIAYQVVSLLEGVVKRGTAASAASLPWALGGKTGTTNESRDTWFMGISPDLVAGVFVGFDSPQPLGSKYTGSSMALPIFKDFISQALKDTPKKEFPAPSGLSRVKVDLESGHPIEPWEDDGRKTIWEVFLREEIPLFKTEAMLALAPLPADYRAKLGMGEYVFDMSVYPNQQQPLPWQTMEPAAAGPLDSFSDYERRRQLPPSTYIPPNDGRGAYQPQIRAPERAPLRRHSEIEVQKVQPSNIP